MMEPLSMVWQATLVLVFGLTGYRYFRRRHREQRDVFVMFATLLGLVVVEWAELLLGGTMQPDQPPLGDEGSSPGPWSFVLLRRIAIVLLLAHPFAMLRVVDHLREVPRMAKQGAFFGFLAASSIVLFSGPTRPMSITMLVAGYFVATEAYAAFMLVKGASGSTGATRMRLRFAALGTFLVGVVIFLAFGWAFVPVDRELASLGLSSMIVAGSIAFYAGFAPPKRLTASWDLRTLHRLQEEHQETGGLNERVNGKIELLLDAVDQIVWPRSVILAVDRLGDLHIEKTPEDTLLPGDLRETGSIMDRCWSSGEPLAIRFDEQGSPWERQQAQRVGAEAALAVPIRRSGTPSQGVCLIFLRSLPLFADQTASFLELMGGSLAESLLMEQLAWEREQERTHALKVEKEALEEADRVKDEFLATMSHEIRTPLNAVIGMADTLQDTELTHEQRASLDTILESGEHLLRLINDILDLSKIQAGELEFHNEPVNIHHLITNVTQLFESLANEKGIHIEHTIEPNTPTYLSLDPARLKQILTNLLHNAVKFTDEGRVHTHVETTGDPNDVRLHIRIEDTGIGIPPNQQDTVFEPFHQVDASTTRTFQGTGLGLAICKRLTDGMNGTIHLESTPNQGTTVHLTLPTQHATPPHPQQPTTALTKSKNETTLDATFAQENPHTILIVEDNDTNRRVAKAMLQNLGYEPDTANDGHQALRKLRDQTYDIILMDLQMPGMNGYETTEQIRADETLPEQPWIIALTAHAGPRYQRKAQQAQMNGYISKPIRTEDLAAHLQQEPPHATPPPPSPPTPTTPKPRTPPRSPPPRQKPTRRTTNPPPRGPRTHPPQFPHRNPPHHEIHPSRRERKRR